jgi:hypothetical protein
MLPILVGAIKEPQKLDCLKDPMILKLESLDFSYFHIFSLAFFVLAIFHTLFAYKIKNWTRDYEIKRTSQKQARPLLVQFLYFLSEVEIVFAFWAIPLFICMGIMYGWSTACNYVNTRDYTEPLFVAVILSMSATKPILEIAEKALHRMAKLLGGSLSAWWFTLLTLGPLLGSFITEVGAMTVCALLLANQFYEYKPSRLLAYATLALLFVNISVGGMLTEFASPAALILAHAWGWTTADMFLWFGWKATLGIMISNFTYLMIFKKELSTLDARKRTTTISQVLYAPKAERPTPLWITLIHIGFLAWIVIVAHFPAIFLASFLIFLGFHQATRDHQYPIRLVRPMLVGLFLAGLVVHGGVQGWWVVKIFQDLPPVSIMGVSMLLTGFNDNAAISYLATLIPGWTDVHKYAIFTGVIAGGGLTVIANAPNPAGYAILSRHFEGGINPFDLLKMALIPTLILYAIFYFFGPLTLSVML